MVMRVNYAVYSTFWSFVGIAAWVLLKYFGNNCDPGVRKVLANLFIIGYLCIYVIIIYNQQNMALYYDYLSK